jgi:ABC-2 type transport system ATP-binding protein
MIVSKDLTKDFGSKRAVDGLTFEVRPGLVTGFLGPNGAGKSTTMRLILGLDHPTHGTVTVNGRRYVEHRAPLQEVGALIDAKGTHPGRTARAHLRALAATHGISSKRVDEVIELAGLETVANKRVGGFSLGMGQRLGLAGALLGDPSTLILDEPVNGLDPEGVAWVRDLVKRLAGHGRTIFLSSHLMSEMALTADHLIILGRGRLIVDAPVEDIIAQVSGTVTEVRSPQSPQIADHLTTAGYQVTQPQPDMVVVTGLTPSQIGEWAAAQGWVIHELSPVTRSLEEAYLRLTEQDQEFTFHTSGRPNEKRPPAPLLGDPSRPVDRSDVPALRPATHRPENAAQSQPVWEPIDPSVVTTDNFWRSYAEASGTLEEHPGEVSPAGTMSELDPDWPSLDAVWSTLNTPMPNRANFLATAAPNPALAAAPTGPIGPPGLAGTPSPGGLVGPISPVGPAGPLGLAGGTGLASPFGPSGSQRPLPPVGGRPTPASASSYLPPSASSYLPPSAAALRPGPDRSSQLSDLAGPSPSSGLAHPSAPSYPVPSGPDRLTGALLSAPTYPASSAGPAGPARPAGSALLSAPTYPAPLASPAPASAPAYPTGPARAAGPIHPSAPSYPTPTGPAGSALPSAPTYPAPATPPASSVHPTAASAASTRPASPPAFPSVYPASAPSAATASALAAAGRPPYPSPNPTAGSPTSGAASQALAGTSASRAYPVTGSASSLGPDPLPTASARSAPTAASPSYPARASTYPASPAAYPTDSSPRPTGSSVYPATSPAGSSAYPAASSVYPTTSPQRPAYPTSDALGPSGAAIGSVQSRVQAILDQPWPVPLRPASELSSTPATVRANLPGPTRANSSPPLAAGDPLLPAPESDRHSAASGPAWANQRHTPTASSRPDGVGIRAMTDLASSGPWPAPAGAASAVYPASAASAAAYQSPLTAPATAPAPLSSSAGRPASSFGPDYDRYGATRPRSYLTEPAPPVPPATPGLSGGQTAWPVSAGGATRATAPSGGHSPTWLSSGSTTGGPGVSLSGVNINRDPITPRPPTAASPQTGRGPQPAAPQPYAQPSVVAQPPLPATGSVRPNPASAPAASPGQRPATGAGTPTGHLGPQLSGRPDPAGPPTAPPTPTSAGARPGAGGARPLTPLIPAPAGPGQASADSGPWSPETTGSLTPLLDQLLAEPDPGASSPSRRGFQSLPAGSGPPTGSTPRLGDAMSITQASLRRLWNKEA